MFEHEAQEDVVERIGRERQVEDVRLAQRHVREAGGGDGLPGLGDGRFRDVDGGDVRLRTAGGEDDGLGADAAAGLENAAAGGIGGVGMEEFFEGGGLVLQAQGFAWVVSMDVGSGHLKGSSGAGREGGVSSGAPAGPIRSAGWRNRGR